MMYSARSLGSELPRFTIFSSYSPTRPGGYRSASRTNLLCPSASLLSPPDPLLHAQSGARRLLLHLLKLRQQLLLLSRQLLRDLDVHGHQEVAVPALLRDPLTPDAERPAVRRPGRDLQRHRSVQRRHLDVRAERRLGVRHRKLEREIRVST